MLRTILAAGAVALAVMLSGCESVEALVGVYGGEKGLSLLNEASKGVEKVEGATLGNAVKALPPYCDNLPPAARNIFRDRINARPEAKGATIAIWCPGDPPITLGAAP